MSNEELVQLVQNGDGDAVLLLWKQVENFIKLMADRYEETHPGFEFDDLVQVGFFAMLQAASVYQQDREASFIHFLSFYLKKEFPKSFGITKRRTVKTKDGKTKTVYSDPLRYAESLNEPLSADDPNGDTLEDIQPDPRDPYEEAERRIWLEQLRQQLNKSLATLPEEQRETIQCRYRDCMNLEQTGAAMQRTKTEVRKLERAALDTLRKGRNRLELEPFIDDLTPFYGKVGIRQFMTDGESIVERCVFKRDALRNHENNS